MSKAKLDAKSVMAWVKSRWSLVVFAVIALLIVPAMVYFAMSMTEAKHQAFEKQVDEDSAVFKSPNIKYSIPGPTGEVDDGWSYPPNEAVSKVYKEARDSQQASVAGVAEEAIKHNKGEADRAHNQLVDGLFPNNVRDLVLARQFRRVYVGDAMRALLDMVNAKEPLASTQLAQVLRDGEANFLSREFGPDAKRDRLTEDKAKALEKEMVDLRVGQYGLWGQKLSVYAGMSIFPNLPPVVESDTPSPLQLWDWQVQYWTMQDVMRSVAAANASARDTGVTKSVVKRIKLLAVDPEGLAQPATMDPGLLPPPPPPPVAGAPAGDATADYSRSITGRKTNPLYDVRTGKLICVVATNDLPLFFDALTKSNMITVTGVKLGKVDQLAELREGYFYGANANVTNVELSFEALWLRDWTKELMPKEVRVALGIDTADPNAAPAPDGAAPGAVPPAAPSAGPPGSGRRAVGG